MKSIVIVKLSLLSLIAISAATRPTPAGPSTLGVFVASSPCDAVTRGPNVTEGMGLTAR